MLHMKHYRIKKNKRSISYRIPENRGELTKPYLPLKLFTKIHKVVRYEIIEPRLVGDDLSNDIMGEKQISN